MQECAAAARDDVHRLPYAAPLVVVEVAGEVEDWVAFERQAAGGEHPRARLVAQPVGHHGIARDEEHGATRVLLAPPREERALPEVDAPELPVAAEEVQA